MQKNPPVGEEKRTAKNAASISAAKAVAFVAFTFLGAFLGTTLLGTPTASADSCGPSYRLSNNLPVRILPLGDSITQGTRQSSIFLSSYRRPLHRSLISENFSIDFVGSQQSFFQFEELPPQDFDFDLDNEGHWGWRADQIADALPSWLNGYEPDIVLLHIGHNDFFQGQSVDSTETEVESILSILRGRCATLKVLLARVIPVRADIENASQLNATINAWNERLAQVASRHGEITLVDQYSTFNASTMTVGDGVHPNEAGQDQMASTWLSALRPILQVPVVDAGQPDTGMADIGMADTGSADIGPSDTSMADTGSEPKDAGPSPSDASSMSDVGGPTNPNLMDCKTCWAFPAGGDAKNNWIFASLALAAVFVRRWFRAHRKGQTRRAPLGGNMKSKERRIRRNP